MKRNTMLAAALLLAAAVLAAAPREARAAADEFDDWNPRYRCGAGAFDLTTVTSQTGAPWNMIGVSVQGALTCEVPLNDPTSARFALAVYWVGSAYGTIDVRRGLLPYASKSGPHPFRVNGEVTITRSAAVCVLSDIDLRLACVLFSANIHGSGGAIVARSIPTSDALVTRPLRHPDSGTSPGCTTCWRIERP